jgi:uncharacterized integral membrane protein (TIGR00698 family)
MDQDPIALALPPPTAGLFGFRRLPVPGFIRMAGILFPGLALAALIAASAATLRQLPGLALLSPLILALGLGMLIGNLRPLSERFRPGLGFALRYLLRGGVVLLGLQLTFGQLAAIGAGDLALVALVLITSFGTTLALGHWLKVDPDLTRLIATGTAICGAAAVAAANGVVRARQEHVAYALASVTIFGSISMLLYPTLDDLLGLSPHAYGLWAGTSIHEVAQVIGAGYAAGPVSGDVATVSKLARVLLLAPVIVAMAWAARRSDANPAALIGEASAMPRPPLVPGFIVGFILVVTINSLGLIPESLAHPLTATTPWLFAAALGALGLEARFDRLRSQGFRPLLVGAGAWLLISGFSLALVVLFDS